MKKVFKIYIVLSTLFLTGAYTTQAQSGEYGYCENTAYNTYYCAARSIYNAQFDNFAWYVTIPSGNLNYNIQIWLYETFGMQSYGSAWISGGGAYYSTTTYNTNWVSEQGSLTVGTSPTWVDAEFYVMDGELTLTANW